jgi:hypothetical protein
MALKRDVKRLLLAKIEVTYGTDPVPTGAANAVIAHWSNFPEPANSDYVDRQVLKPWLGRSQQFVANSKVNLPFDVEIAGSGAAGTAPAWGPIARMCGFAETLNAGVSAVYNPISASEESATLYYNLDDLQQKVTGARGSLGITVQAGQVPYINIAGMGLYAVPTDTAIPAPTFTAWQTPLVVNKVNTPTFTLHGFAAVLRELKLDMKTGLVYRDWVNSKKVDIGGRAPDGSVTIELPSIAAKDYFTAMQGNTLAALQLIHGTVAGNIVQLDAPQVQVTNPRFASESGLALLTLDLALVPSAGNDELTITAK